MHHDREWELGGKLVVEYRPQRGIYLAGRTGGEFVVLQCSMRHPGEADLLARRLARTLGEPYRIGETTITISASVGYVVSRCDERLEELMALADNALYAIKDAGGGAAAHSDLCIGKSWASGCARRRAPRHRDHASSGNLRWTVVRKAEVPARRRTWTGGRTPDGWAGLLPSA